MSSISIAPSTLPHISQCPCFEPSKGGSVNRKQIRGMVLDNDLRYGLQHPAACCRNAEIEWIRNMILKKANGQQVFADKKDCTFTYVHPDSGVEFRGEMDAFTASQVFELKSGDAHPHYIAQLLPYVAHLFERDESLQRAEAHLMFSQCRQCLSFQYTRESVRQELQAILAPWLNPDRKPRIGVACEWCRFLNSRGGWDCMTPSAPTLAALFDFTLPLDKP